MPEPGVHGRLDVLAGHHPQHLPTYGCFQTSGGPSIWTPDSGALFEDTHNKDLTDGSSRISDSMSTKQRAGRFLQARSISMFLGTLLWV